MKKLILLGFILVLTNQTFGQYDPKALEILEAMA